MFVSSLLLDLLLDIILHHDCHDLLGFLIFVQFERRFIALSLDCVQRLPNEVLHGLWFSASIAFLSSPEIIILTHRALPATLRELKIIVVPSNFFHIFHSVPLLLPAANHVNLRRHIIKW